MTAVVYVRELVEDDPVIPDGVLAMDRAIAKLRDEVTGVSMKRHRGNNRALAMAIAKLDEAELWAIAYGREFGSHTVIHRQEIVRKVVTDTTDTTDGSGVADAV